MTAAATAAATATATAIWAGEYRNEDFWAFPPLRGFWNSTRHSPVKCLPNRAVSADVPDLSEAEAAALEAAAAIVAAGDAD